MCGSAPHQPAPIRLIRADPICAGAAADDADAGCNARSRSGLIASIVVSAASVSYFLYAFLSASASIFRSTPSTSYRHILTAGAAAMAEENRRRRVLVKGAGEGG